MENTRIYSFKSAKAGGASYFQMTLRQEQVLQNAYRQTERRIELAAYESGILSIHQRTGQKHAKADVRSADWNKGRNSRGNPSQTDAQF
jgi:hypothetical protein